MLLIQEYLLFSRLLRNFIFLIQESSRWNVSYTRIFTVFHIIKDYYNFFNSRKLGDGMLLIQEYLLFSRLFRINFILIQEN